MFQIRIDPLTNKVYNLPQDVITATNAAWNIDVTSATGYSTAYGVPTGRYLAPANGPDCIQLKAGDCAQLNNYVIAPLWTRFDMSLAKKFPFGGRKTFEIRLDVMNVFNTVNFNTPGSLASTSSAVGQVTSGYTDMSNTFDPGGRFGQVVTRFSW
jgi:hypothetical protein